MSKFVLKIPEVEDAISPIAQAQMALENIKNNVQKDAQKMTKEGWEGKSAESFMSKTNEWLASVESFIGEIESLNSILTGELLPPANQSNTQALAFPTCFEGGSGSGGINTLTLEPSAKDTAVSCCKNMVSIYEDGMSSLDEISRGLGELHYPFTPSPSIEKIYNEINDNIQKVEDFSSELDNYASSVNSFDSSVAGSLSQFISAAVWDEKQLDIAIKNKGSISSEELENMSEDKRMAYLNSLGQMFIDFIPETSFSPGKKYETIISYYPCVTFFYTVGVDRTYNAGENYAGISLAIDEQKKIQGNLSSSTDLGIATFNDDGSYSYSISTKAGEATLKSSLKAGATGQDITYSVTASNKVEDDNLSVSVSSGMGITVYNSNSSQPAYARQPVRVPVAATPEPWYKKAWNSVKDFAVEHPVITTIAVAVAAVAVVAAPAIGAAASAVATGFAAGSTTAGVTAGALDTGGSTIGAISGAVAGGGVATNAALASLAVSNFVLSK